MLEKLYRISVIVVLLLILAVQVYAQFKPQPKISEACNTALDEARAVSDDTGTFLATDLILYRKSAYTTADNIYQQTFTAAEYQYIATYRLNQLQQAQLNIILKCR